MKLGLNESCVVQALDQENVSLYHQENILRLLRDVNEHDPQTHTHSISVGLITRELARIHGLDTGIALVGGLLHDVGKLNVPRALLQTQNRLTSEELAVIRQHPIHSYNLTNGLFSTEVAYMARDHHRHQKNGHPGPAGPMRFGEYSNLVATADFYDAITARDNARGKAAETIDDIFQRFEKERPHQLPLILPYLEETRPHELVPTYRAA